MMLRFWARQNEVSRECGAPGVFKLWVMEPRSCVAQSTCLTALPHQQRGDQHMHTDLHSSWAEHVVFICLSSTVHAVHVACMS